MHHFDRLNARIYDKRSVGTTNISCFFLFECVWVHIHACLVHVYVFFQAFSISINRPQTINQCATLSSTHANKIRNNINNKNNIYKIWTANILLQLQRCSFRCEQRPKSIYDCLWLCLSVRHVLLDNQLLADDSMFDMYGLCVSVTHTNALIQTSSFHAMIKQLFNIDIHRIYTITAQSNTIASTNRTIIDFADFESRSADFEN